MKNVNSIIKYLQNAQNSIFEIILDEGFCTGFFCKIPYTENNNLLLPVLITTYHSLPINRKSIDEIKIILNGENKNILLNNRKKWTNINMDYTIIEVKENEDNIHNFMILDDNILKNNYSKKYYLKQNISIFAINRNDKQLSFSEGILKKYNDYHFSYTSTTYKGCSGGCIINKNNGKVIGFHKGETLKPKRNGLRMGIFLKDVIKDIKKTNNASLSFLIIFTIAYKLYIFLYYY